MKYMLLIHQGSTPTPPSDEWERLSEEEKGAVYGAYKAINETPGVTSGLQVAPPEIKEAIGSYLHFEATLYGETLPPHRLAGRRAESGHRDR